PTMRRAVCTARFHICANLSMSHRHLAADLDRRVSWCSTRLTDADYAVSDRDHDDSDRQCRERCVQIVVEDDAPHLGQRLGRRQNLLGCESLAEFLSVTQESDLWIWTEDLLESSGDCADDQPDGWHDRDPRPALALHLVEHDRAQGQCD